METGCLYVIRSPSGLRKIGFSRAPESRLVSVRNANAIKESGDHVMEFTEECPVAMLPVAEKHAHVLLWDGHVKGEWFRVDADAARMAIWSGIESARQGVPMPRKPNARPIKLNVMLTPTEAQRVEDLLHAERRRSVSTLVRDLLMEALAARARAGGADEKP